MSQQLVAVNVADPMNLYREVVIPSRPGWNVAAANGTVYLAVSTAGLDIYEDAINEQGRRYWNYNSTAVDGQVVYDVNVVGNLAILAAGPAGLKLLDVSNPAAVRVVGQVAMPSGAKAMWLASNTGQAVVTDDRGYVHLVDLSDFDTVHPAPRSVQIARTVPTSGVASQIELVNSGLFGSLSSAGLDLFLLVGGEFRRTATVDTVALGGRPADSFYIANSTLFVAYSNGGVWPFELHALNVVDAEAPYVLQSIESAGEVAGIIKGAVPYDGSVLWCSSAHDLFSMSYGTR